MFCGDANYPIASYPTYGNLANYVPQPYPANPFFYTSVQSSLNDRPYGAIDATLSAQQPLVPQPPSSSVSSFLSAFPLSRESSDGSLREISVGSEENVGSKGETRETRSETRQLPAELSPSSQSTSRRTSRLFRPIDFDGDSSGSGGEPDRLAGRAASTMSAKTYERAFRPPVPLGLALPSHGVAATLANKSLWNKFESIGTEMIVTRAGRYNILTNGS